MNYYEELQVSPSADTELIDIAWRRLMRRYHPDNRETGNGEKARAVNLAHDVLMDPKKRALYDQSLQMNGGPHGPAANGKAHAGPQADPWGHVDPTAYPDPYAQAGAAMQEVMEDAAVDIGSIFIRHAMKSASPALRKMFEDALLKRGLDR
jgi:curved DNA-binding protein CbpA